MTVLAQPSDDPPRSGDEPRPRRSREELHDLVLASGREVLLTEGLGTGAEHLTFKRVLAHLGATRGIRVTNASVIRRIWDNQEEFQLEVVRSLVAGQGDLEVEVTAEALDEAVARIDLTTPATRRASLAELIRVACARYLEAASGSTASIQMALGTYIAANGLAGSNSPMVEEFRALDRRLTDQYMELYAAGLAAVGWRVRPELSLGDAATALSAFAEGVLLRKMVEPEVLHTITRVRPSDGTEVEWSLLAIGMDSMVEFFAEPDPDVVV
jgi:hypothetical protein